MGKAAELLDRCDSLKNWIFELLNNNLHMIFHLM